jgi:hypothetical protein
VYQTVYTLQPKVAKHERTVYGFLAMIGDLGGVTEIIMLMFGFFMYPINEFSFNMRAMKRWFVVSTTEKDLMMHSINHNHDKIPSNINIPEDVKKEIRKNKCIKFSIEDQIRLYLGRLLQQYSCNFLCKCFSRRYTQLNSIYNMGTAKIDENLDIKEIIKKLRCIDIMMVNSVLTEDIKYLVRHNKANQLVLESSQCSVSNEGVQGEINAPGFKNQKKLTSRSS